MQRAESIADKTLVGCLEIFASVVLIEPTAAPEGLTGHNTSSMSISVSWGEVPAADRNGIILSYTVSYQSQTESDTGNKTVLAPTQELELTGLKEFVKYNITVLATTVKGDGPASGVIVVSTDQDSKLVLLW